MYVYVATSVLTVNGKVTSIVSIPFEKEEVALGSFPVTLNQEVKGSWTGEGGYANIHFYYRVAKWMVQK